MKPSDLQKMVSNEAAAIYNPAGPRTDKVRALFQAMDGRKKVLDVGCATGAILSPFAQTHDLHGVDIAPTLVAEAVKAGVKAVVHDLETGPLPHDDKSFDVVFCGETIEHHVDTDWMISEINRVLKPGGTLILTFPNIRTPLGLAMMLLADLPPMYASRYRSGHFRDFTLRTIKMVFLTHGFSVDRCMGSAFYLPRIGEFWSGLGTYLPSWTHTTIVVGTKRQDSVYDKAKAIGALYGPGS